MRGRIRAAFVLALLILSEGAVAWYVLASARAVLAAPLDGVARGVNLAVLAIEATLAGFSLLLLGALARAPRAAPPAADAAALADAPRVLLAVPVFKEPAHVLAATLAAARRLAWPEGRLVLVVLDDTPPGAAADAVRAAALAAGAAYERRASRRGRKAGALNDALARHPDCDVVAVLDVDHEPEPDWLARAVPILLAREDSAYVQGRLAWRNADAPLRRLQAMLQAHFYEIIQRAKAERGVAVFAGSGAVFRRAALADAGGFPEATLVEDFDATTELLRRGWRGEYLPAVVARGLLAWTASDLARQLWRWAHGTTRVLVRQARPLAFSSPRASFRTRFECFSDASAYLAAGLFVVVGALLAFAALAEVPLVREGGPPLMAAGLVAFAHVATGAVALARAGDRGYRWLLPYHVMSIAFAPVVLAGAVAGLLGVGEGAEGRVAKDARAARRRRADGPAWAAVAALGLGVALVVAAAAFIVEGHAWWAWSLEIGIAFSLPLVVGAAERAATPAATG